MAKRTPKKRPKKKGPAPRKHVETKKKWNKQQIGVAIIGTLVVLSMSISILIRALTQ